ncbi:hypothetical protein MGG_15121 [Pyricularia oryzae 70-15]|uniref:Major facilitator superfamily (MFS) profile domain-containing protein n=1 Tax=Pyricularia oryzae (strain 70-15 / ATCC MYA-4617 / FGSC 8958) TaxID=242507 RepID=G4N3X2_PYRO7|nr:uncharacterized protein MGG_15121 [Pyricularia oryzae 70-15]EHA52745.1 hypothetical protein MGG_15121 [Pyricularia oryzae 70-15]
MIVTDASPQKYWSNLFFYGQAAHIFAELVGPVMGPALIENSLWQPLLLGLGLSCYTLGSGFGPFARSLLSSLVEKDMVGTLYTTLSIMDTLGSLLAGPVVAGIFGWSMRLDGVWKGMPYLVSFVLCGLASVALSCLGFLDSLPTEHVQAAYNEETAPLLASDIPPSESHD